MSSILSHPKYRRDIDGLRAIAVLPVVAFHAFPSWLKGGFIGVDIFFVISGYLISTIIFENLYKETFSFSEFYARRISRIFPTLMIVMISCALIGWLVMLPDEFSELNKHIAAGTAFVSNFMLWSESGYFDVTAETKPLLHLWSLGIEEQFYIAWPALLWLASKRRSNLLLLTITLASVSFLYNVFLIGADPVATFYFPQTRFWELLCGSILAWVTLNNPKIFENKLWNTSGKIHSVEIGYWRRAWMFLTQPSIVGFLVLIYGFTTIHEGPRFPGIWAVVPVLGAVLLIAAGPSAWINQSVLSNPMLVWIGKISFPLYLWHWPLLAIVRTVEGGAPDWKIRAGVVVLSVLLAWLTYLLIEIPVRRFPNSFFKIFVLTALMAIIGFSAFAAYTLKFGPKNARDIQSLTQQIGQTIPPADAYHNNRCRSMFPERLQMTSKERDDNFCHLEKDGPPNVIMIGDSMNLSLFPGVEGISGANVLVLSASSAAPMYNIRTTDWNDVIRKNNYKLTNQALDYAISTDAIKVVILSFLNGPAITDKNSGFNITDINDLEEKDAQLIFTRALSKTLEELTKHKKSIIFVLPNPMLSFDIKSCLKDYRPFKFSAKTKNECADPYDRFMEQGGAKYQEWVNSVLMNFPDVEVFDLAKQVCNAGKCWGMKDGKIMYRDHAHLSTYGSHFVAPKLIEMIRQKLQPK